MSKSVQNSKRLSSVQVEETAYYLGVLGLHGRDARRLAQRIIEGAAMSHEDYIARLKYACRTTYGKTQKLLFCQVQKELTIYGPNGYAIVDPTAGWVDFAYKYRAGNSFERATKLYTDVHPITGSEFVAQSLEVEAA